MSDSQSTPPQSRGWLRDVGIAMCVLAAMGGLVFYFTRPKPLPPGITRLDYERAEHELRQKDEGTPRPETIFFQIGEKEFDDHHFTKALVCFEQVPSDDPELGLAARVREGETYVKLNQAKQAENRFKQALKLSEQFENPPQRQLKTIYEWLNFLLSVELRFEERQKHLQALHRLGLASVFDSRQLYFPHLLIWRSPTGRERVRDFLKEDPTNPDLLIASGRYLTAEGKLEEAVTLLNDTWRKHPTNLYSAAALLECYFERSDDSEFERVLRSLPSFNSNEPWLLTQMRGNWALQHNRPRDAERYFQHVLKSDPANPESQMGLSRAYGQLGEKEARQTALRRSQVLAKIRVLLSNVTESDPQASLELASICEGIELKTAAQTFREHAKRLTRLHERATANPYFVK